VLSSPLIAISSVLFAKANYDAQKDLAAVTMVGLSRKVIAVHPTVPARTLKELVALARKNPGKLNFGSGGVGTSNHLTAELLKSVTASTSCTCPTRGRRPRSLRFSPARWTWCWLERPVRAAREGGAGARARHTFRDAW
jgi:tripartite-type tricarboxylate transporter receptor subunit TctC